MAERDIGGFIRDMRRNAKVSLRQLAEQAGVSNPYLSQIERGLRKPSAEVLQQIANALKVSTPLMYLRAGLLNQKDGQGTLAAIAGDPELTSRQKQTLTEIYQAFRRENARNEGVDLDDDAEEPIVTDADVAEAADGVPEEMGFEEPEETSAGPDAPSAEPEPATATAGSSRGARTARAKARKRTAASRAAQTETNSELIREEKIAMTDRKLPSPVYAAAGAGEAALDQLRKIPEKVEELRDRAKEQEHKLEERTHAATAVVRDKVEHGVQTLHDLDADKVRTAYSETAATLNEKAKEAREKAKEVYAELVERGETVAAGNRSPVKVKGTIEGAPEAPAAAETPAVEEPKPAAKKPAAKKTVKKQSK